MKRTFMLLCLVFMAAGVMSALAESETASNLKLIKKERARLSLVRNRLEQRLGILGRQLRRLDEALVAARGASRQAGLQLARAELVLTRLQQRQHRLEGRMDRLRLRMQEEVAAAYRRGDRSFGSFLLLHKASVSELPHMKYMLSRLLAAQEGEKRDYVDGLAELSRLEGEARQRRNDLKQLHIQKNLARKHLAARQQAKRSMWSKVRQDATLASQRDRQLATQEKALARLLAGLRTRLSSADAASSWVSVRQLKGKLAWPLKGKIVASFGSRPAPHRPRLAGVQLAPRGSARQVKSIAAGQVRYADWFGGFGLMMIVDHGDGLMSIYAHNDAFFRSLGDWVEAGEVLGEAGSTGWAEKVLLYFELRDAGRPVNPARWCRAL